MTTLTSLIDLCLQRPLAPLFSTALGTAFDTNQPVPLVRSAQAATVLVASTCLTPARSIHAPTLENLLAG